MPYEGTKDITNIRNSAGNVFNRIDTPFLTAPLDTLVRMHNEAEKCAKNAEFEQISHYPELYAKPHKTHHELPCCVTSFLKGSCESGHQFVKALQCGKEWCQECGKPGSWSHERRMARWWSKAMSMKSQGYMVVTCPAQAREKLKDKKLLSEFRTYLKRLLQREGYIRGLLRFHWAGECEVCRGNHGEGCPACQYTGAGRTFKPHLNALFEAGYIPKKDLIRLKVLIAAWFKNKLGVKAAGNIYYQYTKDPGMKVHRLKYVTRATWRFYNSEVCEVLKGFRTSSTWGKFDKSEVERTSELVSLENGECPCCGSKVTWSAEILSIRHFRVMPFEHVSAGYFMLNNTS